jgi:hypothetical protein
MSRISIRFLAGQYLTLYSNHQKKKNTIVVPPADPNYMGLSMLWSAKRQRMPAECAVVPR